jgi:hypothetical protein
MNSNPKSASRQRLRRFALWTVLFGIIHFGIRVVMDLWMIGSILGEHPATTHSFGEMVLSPMILWVLSLPFGPLTLHAEIGPTWLYVIYIANSLVWGMVGAGVICWFLRDEDAFS